MLAAELLRCLDDTGLDMITLKLLDSSCGRTGTAAAVGDGILLLQCQLLVGLDLLR